MYAFMCVRVWLVGRPRCCWVWVVWGVLIGNAGKNHHCWLHRIRGLRFPRKGEARPEAREVALEGSGQVEVVRVQCGRGGG